MKSRFRSLRRWLPPILVEWVTKNRGSRTRYGWFGDYRDWEAAVAASLGYDDLAILDRVKTATLAVMRGDAPYERDSVLFKRVHYSWPVLAALLWVAARDGGRLCVLDFGGALGTTYFQNRRFLKDIEHLRWNVVEQPHFVAWGRSNSSEKRLAFFDSISECCARERPNVVLFSGVLGCLPDPFPILEEVFARRIGTIILDRTAVFETLPTRITVQRVDPKIYDASYPCRIFNETELVAVFRRDYDLAETFTAFVNAEFYVNHDKSLKAGDRGYVFRRKGHD